MAGKQTPSTSAAAAPAPAPVAASTPAPPADAQAATASASAPHLDAGAIAAAIEAKFGMTEDQLAELVMRQQAQGAAAEQPVAVVAELKALDDATAVAAKVMRTVTLRAPGAEPRTRLVPVYAEEVLAWRDYGTHVVVVTNDGQKFSSAAAH